MGILDTDHCCFNDAGMAAGLYSGLTYGLKETRGVHDWVNYGGFCRLEILIKLFLS